MIGIRCCGQFGALGSYDANSNELVVACAAGLFIGKADEASPAPLASTPAIGAAPVLWAGAWSGYVGASTADRMFVRAPTGAWWWEWASDDGTADGGDGRVNGPSDCGDASGGAVEFVVTSGAFDPAYVTISQYHDFAILSTVSGRVGNGFSLPFRSYRDASRVLG